MTRLRLIRLSSIAAIRESAPAWDDLWWRSDATRPIARAELVAQWLEQFAPRAALDCLAVVDQGQWVAALPLVRESRCRVLGSGALPWNEWSPSGDLLLDPGADTDAVLDVLTAGLRDLPWPLLWLDGVPVDAPRWRAMIAAVERAGMSNECRVRWHVPLIEIDHDWDACQRRWPKQHRSKMLKAQRSLANRGDVQCVTHSQVEPPQIEALLRRAFDVEDRSWKGQSGTSVLRAPGMFDFFVRQATQLAEWGQLELSFLELDGQAVAFVYGFGSKGVSCWHKIGYDPEFRSASPGQLLQYHILERSHRNPESVAVDCMGPLSDALSRWRPSVYPLGRLIVAPRALLGRIALHGYKHWWPRIARLLGRRNAEAATPREPEIAAEREGRAVEAGG
jgi:CelD/BcsL family acetyltransferase involved in cellulose biosynthesis